MLIARINALTTRTLTLIIGLILITLTLIDGILSLLLIKQSLLALLLLTVRTKTIFVDALATLGDRGKLVLVTPNVGIVKISERLLTLLTLGLVVIRRDLGCRWYAGERSRMHSTVGNTDHACNATDSIGGS